MEPSSCPAPLLVGQRWKGVRAVSQGGDFSLSYLTTVTTSKLHLQTALDPAFLSPALCLYPHWQPQRISATSQPGSLRGRHGCHCQQPWECGWPSGNAAGSWMALGQGHTGCGLGATLSITCPHCSTLGVFVTGVLAPVTAQCAADPPQSCSSAWDRASGWKCFSMQSTSVFPLCLLARLLSFGCGLCSAA